MRSSSFKLTLRTSPTLLIVKRTENAIPDSLRLQNRRLRIPGHIENNVLRLLWRGLLSAQLHGRSRHRKAIGFGFPGSSSSSNKALQEGTLGVIRTFWKD